MVRFGGIAPLFARAVLLLLLLARAAVAQTHLDRSSAPLTASLRATAVEIQKHALQYFLDNSNPTTGQVLDKACNFSASCPEASHVASIAATGFGLAVIANASTRGWVTEKFAARYARKTIAFAVKHILRRRGWFIHFYDWQSGARVWNSEYSTIDTAIFLAGALYASEVLHDPQITAMTFEIYRAADFWDMMTNGGTLPNKRTLSMAYFDKTGYTAAQWDMYAEEMILLVLGLGHPTHPLPPEIWRAFHRDRAKNGLMGATEPLFVHQYSQLFIDFRSFSDGYKNYFENSRLVSLYQRHLRDEIAVSRTLRAGFWGFSAGWSPSGYQVSSPFQHGATVCIGCSIASSMFLPNRVLSDVNGWLRGPYAKRIWGRYGFTDSINIDRAWFSNVVLAITVGPEYLSLANLDSSHSVWKNFMTIPEIKNGLARAREADRFRAQRVTVSKRHFGALIGPLNIQ